VLIRAEDSTLAALLECVRSISATRVVYNRLYGNCTSLSDTIFQDNCFFLKYFVFESA
jgi:hypothetical protein